MNRRDVLGLVSAFVAMVCGLIPRRAKACELSFTQKSIDSPGLWYLYGQIQVVIGNVGHGHHVESYCDRHGDYLQETFIVYSHLSEEAILLVNGCVSRFPKRPGYGVVWGNVIRKEYTQIGDLEKTLVPATVFIRGMRRIDEST